MANVTLLRELNVFVNVNVRGKGEKKIKCIFTRHLMR